MSYNFSLTRTQIIEEAFRLLVILGAGQSLTNEQLSRGVFWLNSILASWQMDGMHLWTTEEIYIFPDKTTNLYYLGNLYASPAKACYRSDATLTTLSTAGAASATSLTVGTTTGMTVGDYIGVVLDTGYIHWTTIATLPTSTTLTLTSGLASAAAAAKNVYTFTSIIEKPLRVHTVRRVTGTIAQPSTIEIEPYSREDYMSLPSKNTQGTIIAWHYLPRKTYGEFYVYPVNSTGQNYLEATIEKPIAITDTASDIADIPPEWSPVIVETLAVALAPIYGREDKVSKLIVPLAQDLKSKTDGWDSEMVSVNFAPGTN